MNYLRELAAGDVQDAKDCQGRLSKAGATFLKRLRCDDRFKDDRFDELRSICEKLAAKPLWAKPNILVLDAAVRWIRDEFPGCKFLDRKYGTQDVGWDAEYLRVNVAELARFVDELQSEPEAPAIPEAKNASDRTNAILAAVTDDITPKIIQIAGDKSLSSDAKLRLIVRLDSRFKHKTSDELGTLLGGISGAAIRLTTWWKVDRKKDTCE